MTADIENLLKSLSIRPITYKKPNKKYRTGYLNRIELFGKFDCLRVISKTRPYIKNRLKKEKLKKLEKYFLLVKTKRRKGNLQNEILSYLKIRNFSIKELSQKLKINEEPVRRKLLELCSRNILKRVKVGRIYRFYLY